MVQLLSNFFDIFVLTGWGQRDWWVTEESDEEWKNDDKLHEVKVISWNREPVENQGSVLELFKMLPHSYINISG